jgi:ribosomal protein L11
MTLRKPSNPSTGSARAPSTRLAVAVSALALAVSLGMLSLAGQAGAAIPVGAVVGNVGATAVRDLDKATRSVPAVPVPSVASATAPATRAIEQTTGAASDTLGKAASTTTANAVGTVSGLASATTGAGEAVANATTSDASLAHAGAAVTGVLHHASSAGVGALVHSVSHVPAVPPRSSPADGAPVSRPASVAPSPPRVGSAHHGDDASPVAAAISGDSSASPPAVTNAPTTTSAGRMIPSRCAASSASGFRLADGCSGRGAAPSAIVPLAILPAPASALLAPGSAPREGPSVQALAPAGSGAGHGSTPAPAPSPPEPAPSPGLSASAGGASGLALSLLLTLTALLLLAAPPTLRRLRLANESWRPAPFALIPERPG